VPDARTEEQFLLYFQFIDGRVIDFIQRGALEEAMDEVGKVGPRANWRACSNSPETLNESQGACSRSR